MYLLHAQRMAVQRLADRCPASILHGIEETHFKLIFAVALASPLQPRVGQQLVYDECLFKELFLSKVEAQVVADWWRRFYNVDRLH
jgi:hypothetical protein